MEIEMIFDLRETTMEEARIRNWQLAFADMLRKRMELILLAGVHASNAVQIHTFVCRHASYLWGLHSTDPLCIWKLWIWGTSVLESLCPPPHAY